MKYIIYLLAITLINSSCNTNSLSKEEALKILKEDYSEICRGGVKSRIKDNSLLDYCKELSSQGLIRMYKQSNNNQYTLTQKAADLYNGTTKKNYFLDPVNLAVAEVIAVNGISLKDDNTAMVNFTIKFKETPFYRLRQKNKCTTGASQEREMEFIKFDTGWRIKK